MPETLQYGRGRDPGPLARWLLKPIGLGTHLMTLLAAGVGIWVQAMPGPDIIHLLLWALVVALAASAWLGWAAVRTLVAIICRRPRSAYFLGWKRWLFAPAVAIVFAIVSAAGLPLRISFHFARPTMDRVARAALAGAIPQLPQRAGPYMIDHCLVYGPGVYLVTNRAMYKTGLGRGSGGFAYFPPGTFQELSPDCVYTAVGGEWYSFYITP